MPRKAAGSAGVLQIPSIGHSPSTLTYNFISCSPQQFIFLIPSVSKAVLSSQSGVSSVGLKFSVAHSTNILTGGGKHTHTQKRRTFK